MRIEDIRLQIIRENGCEKTPLLEEIVKVEYDKWLAGEPIQSSHPILKFAGLPPQNLSYTIFDGQFTVDIKKGEIISANCSKNGKIAIEVFITFTTAGKLPIIFQSKEIFMDENLNASWGHITEYRDDAQRYRTTKVVKNTYKEAYQEALKTAWELQQQLQRIVSENEEALKHV